MLPKFISSKIPVIGPAVGPTLLFNYNRNIINVRSSYEDEITGIVNYLVNTRVIRKIGFVYQVFAGGIDMYQSFLRVLSVTELPSSGIYAMNSTNDIRAACDQLFINNVEAIIVASRGASYAALFMNCMRDRNSTVPMITTSIVDQATLTLLLHKFNDILMSQVVPSLTDTSIQLPSMFLSALNTSFPNKTPTSLSLSGYITGKLITSVLSSMLENGIRQVNQKTFLDSLYRGISYVYVLLQTINHLELVAFIWVNLKTNVTVRVPVVTMEQQQCISRHWIPKAHYGNKKKSAIRAVFLEVSFVYHLYLVDPPTRQMMIMKKVCEQDSKKLMMLVGYEVVK
jgi:hypothetical protein